MKQYLLTLLLTVLVTKGYTLTVSEQPIKVCQGQDVLGAPCAATGIDLMEQTYNFSTAANSENLARSFSYTDDAETTTSVINNKIVFECQKSSNPIDEVLSDITPQLSTTVEFVNKFSSSCLEILNKNASAESGFYLLLLKNGSTANVYCDMVGTDCEELGGWTRIGYFNMLEPGYDSCPGPALSSRSYTELDHDLCQRTSANSGCDSFYFDNMGIEYQTVCGRALGYQYGSPDGFQWSWYNIDSVYVDGLSITHGSPRQHIWTFGAGVFPHGTNQYNCPCNQGSTFTPPNFLGGNYYCESGNDPYIGWAVKLYSTDKLWDGKECEANEADCCPANNNMPWFSRILSDPTTDQVELRMCDDEPENNERVPLEMVEIFVR